MPTAKQEFLGLIFYPTKMELSILKVFWLFCLKPELRAHKMNYFFHKLIEPKVQFPTPLGINWQMKKVIKYVPLSERNALCRLVLGVVFTPTFLDLAEYLRDIETQSWWVNFSFLLIFIILSLQRSVRNLMVSFS